MFWADNVAQELKKRKLPLEWVDDMKTPSGKIHVGALRGVMIHDLVYKALQDVGVKTKYTYIFDDHDPMDGLPVYLPKGEYEKHLGKPLYTVPSPEKGYENYARFYAQDFIKTFNAIGCYPEILWSTDLYGSGKMNDVIKLCLDKTLVVKNIYEELYKKPLPKDWYPFQVYCPNCGKVSTTKVTAWDGKEVTFCCEVDRLDWTKGCGICAKVSPFSNDGKIAGKLPWKVEWAAKWKVIGVTVEGAGKDHMSAGGSHDLASLVCQKVLDYPIPYPFPYEWFLVGGRKMSTSKGVGVSASDMLDILPPELLRFLMVKTRMNQAINFDPSGDTIPKLFDEYQKAADAYFSRSASASPTGGSGGNKTDEDLARIFVLSQIDSSKIQRPPSVSFLTLAQWVQAPNMQEQIKKENAGAWIPYVKTWIDRFAPEKDRFTIQKEVPKQAKNLSEDQKKYLEKLVQELNKKWEPEALQKQLYEWAKELGIPSQKAFAAIYLSLFGKTYGPKAGWVLLQQDYTFLKKRLEQIIGGTSLN